VWITEASGPV